MLRIVTHTPSTRGRFYWEAIESAGPALAGSIASHDIIVVPAGEYYEARKEVWSSGGYVGLLDHDDTFPGGFLVRGFEPYLNGVGVVYGREARMDEKGQRISDWSGVASAESVAASATGIHHFALVNTDCIDPGLFGEVERAGAMLCLDWVVRSYAALLHGAHFVNARSYNWRQHCEQVTHNVRGEIATAHAAACRIVQGFYHRRCEQWHKPIRL